MCRVFLRNIWNENSVKVPQNMVHEYLRTTPCSITLAFSDFFFDTTENHTDTNFVKLGALQRFVDIH